jgi:hypothetical protein
MSDRVIREGFPDGWFVQDRIKSGEALLCRPHMTFGATCVCLRPGAITTDEWLPTARRIANALAAVADPDQELVSELRGAADEEDTASQREFHHAELLRRAADALDPSTPRPLVGWKRKFKGTSRGGAHIHTHPDAERAIVENHHGITFDGKNYLSLEDAKTAALNDKVPGASESCKIICWHWQFEANGPWHSGPTVPQGVYHSQPVFGTA